MNAPRTPWQTGDIIPHFNCPSSNNPNFSYGSVGGIYSVLCFFGAYENPAVRGALDHILSRHAHFNDDRLCFFGVTMLPDDKLSNRLPSPNPSFRYFYDFDHQLSKQFGAVLPPAAEQDAENSEVAYRPFTLIMDPTLRVLASIPMMNAEAHNRAFDAIINNLPKNPADHAGVPVTAPVLVVPRVFDQETCQKLIAYYKEKGGKESGFMREVNGKTTPVMDYGFKRRSDVHIEDEALQNELIRKIRRALAPSITKAFQFKPTRMERYLIACYDSATQGFFKAHRDNTTKGTAHRKFACSINLNAEDYDGGDLIFPEFGRKTYRAPTGGAVIFSCSLLHEATPVTRGERYAFLPFFYDEEGHAIREKNREFLTDQVLNLNAKDKP